MRLMETFIWFKRFGGENHTPKHTGDFNPIMNILGGRTTSDESQDTNEETSLTLPPSRATEGETLAPAASHPVISSPLVIPRGVQQENPRTTGEGDDGVLTPHNRGVAGRGRTRRKIGSSCDLLLWVLVPAACRRLHGEVGFGLGRRSTYNTWIPELRLQT